jgi:hypothetical protein
MCLVTAKQGNSPTKINDNRHTAVRDVRSAAEVAYG